MGIVRRYRPPVITDAQPSQDAQLLSREIRYVIMMGIRALCLVAAAVLVSVHAPYLGIWLPLLLFGMLVLPWLAVILANERPAKAKYRLAGRLHHGAQPEPPGQGAVGPGDGTTPQHKVIDHDEN
jgi:hypothetical protein